MVIDASQASLAVFVLYGLPDLEERDLETAWIGNFQIRHAVRLIKLSMASGRSGSLENPATSRARLVLTQMLSRKIASGKCRIIVVDICGYGIASNKPTRLLIWGKFATRVELRRCNGKRGLCVVTLEYRTCSSLVCRTFFFTNHAQVYCETFVADLSGQLLLGHRPLQFRRRGAADVGHAL